MEPRCSAKTTLDAELNDYDRNMECENMRRQESVNCKC